MNDDARLHGLRCVVPTTELGDREGGRQWEVVLQLRRVQMRANLRGCSQSRLASAPRPAQGLPEILRPGGCLLTESVVTECTVVSRLGRQPVFVRLSTTILQPRH